MKNRLIFIFVILISPYTLVLQAQDKAETVDVRPNGLSLTIVGASHGIGITYDKMLSNRVSLEGGIGTNAAFIGFRYYFIDPTRKRWAFYSGLSHTFYYPTNFDFYIPLGVSYLSSGNIHISLDVGGLFGGYWIENGKFIHKWHKGGRLDIYPYAGLKAGYRFNNSSREIGERKTIHSVQAEAGGSSVFYSIRYDLNTQFGKSPFKLSVAPGISHWNNGVYKNFLIPARFTLLAGGSLNAEAGVDISMGSYSIRSFLHNRWISYFFLYALPYAGIRYQERRRGIVVMLGAVATGNTFYLDWMERLLDPYNVDIDIHSTVIWPSISIGYTFRY